MAAGSDDVVEPSVEEGEDEEEEVNPIMAEVLEAAENGDVDALAELLSKVGVNDKGEDGDTALNIACLYGQKAVVQELLRRGATVNTRDEDDSTPLHDACAGGYADIASLLLKAKAEVLAIDSDGESPLHLACNGGHHEVAKLLLDAGADATHANSAGSLPADLAEQGSEVEKMVREAAQKQQTK